MKFGTNLSQGEHSDFRRGDKKIGLGQLLQTVLNDMLLLHLVLKQKFINVNKLIGPISDFMTLFYCFCNLEYFGMLSRYR